MEKNKKLIISAATIIILAVILYIVSLSFPPSSEDDSKGTIGKVEKFRKNQLTAKDVLLSDDLLKDTLALKNTIGEIGQFATFSIEISVLIKGYWLPEINANWQTEEGKEVSKNLSDFASFIDNNIEKTAATQNVLYNIYLKKEKTGTEDVGSKLANFVNYVLQLMERDSVMENTINRLNNYLASTPQVKGNLGKQLKKLQSLRDKIIVDTFLYGTVLGDKKKSEFAAEQKLNVIEVGAVTSALGFDATSSLQMVVLEKAAALNIVIYVAHDLGSNARVLNEIDPGVVALEMVKNVLGSITKNEIGFVDVVEGLPYCSAANNLINYVVRSTSIFNKEVASTASLNVVLGKDAIGTLMNSRVSVLSSQGPSIFNREVLWAL
ncbi:MAG: hypothetical protein RBR95_05360 [Ignavibacteriaceae bacterium]|jgi:hypothetical protein|nr:hypothetical protein [Ignavibacteriaceae bacterium]